VRCTTPPPPYFPYHVLGPWTPCFQGLFGSTPSFLRTCFAASLSICTVGNPCLSSMGRSVVGAVNPNNVPVLLPALFLSSKRLKVEKTTQANRYTQCTNCYKFGHASPQCAQKHPTCPHCALHHTRSAHTCQNPTCPKGGDTKAVSGRCPTSPPYCLNCSHDHDAFSRECGARPIPPPQHEAPPPSDEELSDASSDSQEAMDVGDNARPAPTTPEAPSTQIIELSTPRPLQRSRDAPAPPQRVPASTHWPGPATGNSLLTHGFVPDMIKSPRSTSRQGLALATNLTLIQHNSLGSWDVFLSLFSSLAEGPPTDILLLLDPPSSKGFLPSFPSFKSFAPPMARPRVACYISQKYLQKFAVQPFLPPDTDDFIALDVFTPQGCFGTKFPRFTIGNAYARPLPPSTYSVSPESSLLDLEHPYLVACDFNIHNAATDPSRLLFSKEKRESTPYFERASDLGFALLNLPGVYTVFPFTGTHRPSTINLVLANPHMFPAFRSWDTSSLACTEFDHAPIWISIHPHSPYNKMPRPRWQQADWPSFTDRLRSWQIPPPPDTPSPNQLDQWFSSALSALTTTMEATAPRSRPSSNSKAWWTPLLTTL